MEEDITAKLKRMLEEKEKELNETSNENVEENIEDIDEMSDEELAEASKIIDEMADFDELEDTKSKTRKQSNVNTTKEISSGKLKQIVRVDTPEEADLRDISYMISETMPEAMSDYVIDIAGKPVLTYAGILRAAVETGNIECTVEIIENTQRRSVCKAKARHLERNITIEGIGIVDLDIEEERIRRLKEKYSGNPRRYRDYDEQLARLKEYKLQIAFSRAQRNALRCLINEREFARMWSRYLTS